MVVITQMCLIIGIPKLLIFHVGQKAYFSQLNALILGDSESLFMLAFCSCHAGYILQQHRKVN